MAAALCKWAVIPDSDPRLGSKRGPRYLRTASDSLANDLEVISMGYEQAKTDVKKTIREADNQAKETWRRADGEESVSDKVANTADDIRTGLGNAGDDVRAEGDKWHKDVDRDKV
jgi:hypothetical protein